MRTSRFLTAAVLMVCLQGIAGERSACESESSALRKIATVATLADQKQDQFDLPNQEALSKWREVPGYVTNHTDLATYPRLKVECADQNLYPTHPQQNAKLYHVFNSNQYNHFKLKADDRACRIGMRPPHEGVPGRCARADIAYDVMISDTYKDSCGTLYRGFVRKQFLQRDESMGSLFSAGRMVYQNPNSTIENDMVVGNPYPVPVSEFAIIGPLLDGDQALINRAQLTH